MTHTEVKQIFTLAQWAFWEYAKHELVNPKNHFRSVKPLESEKHPKLLKNVLATTSMSKRLCSRVPRIIETASKEIFVASFRWEENHKIIRLLYRRAREGFPVTVLARIQSSEMPALVALAVLGATVYGFNWLHAKALCADGERAVIFRRICNRMDLTTDLNWECGSTMVVPRRFTIFLGNGAMQLAGNLWHLRG